MSYDGFLVDGLCVVTPSSAATGRAAIDKWYSEHEFFFDMHYGNTVQHTFALDPSSNYPAGTVGATYGELSFPIRIYDYTNNTSQLTYVSLSKCDSSIFPADGLAILSPDVSTAIPLVIAIWLVWTVGFGLRMLVRALRDTDENIIE